LEQTFLYAGDGVLSSAVIHQDGDVVEVRRHDASGDLATKSYFADGIQQREIDYRANEQVARDVAYLEGQPVEETSYDDSGRLTRRVIHREGLRMEVVAYDPAGWASQRSNHKNGELQGETVTYNEDGPVYR
jgi:antitoxin component YwqK of YwqJK toxin-antitoxin module